MSTKPPDSLESNWKKILRKEEGNKAKVECYDLLNEVCEVK